MNEIGFLVFYLLGLIPTYILPYFGSNSYAAKAVGAGLSAITNTHTNFSFSLTILHMGALALCVAIAWVRGKSTNKSWIVVLPIIAAVFDMAPVLNMVPFVPTVLHVIALVKGFMPSATEVNDNDIPEPRTILLLIGGIVGGTLLWAGGNWATSLTAGANDVKQAAERQERERKEGPEPTKAPEPRPLAVAPVVSTVQARAVGDAFNSPNAIQPPPVQGTVMVMSLKELESKERMTLEARDRLFSQFNNTEIQTRLNNFASALNKSDGRAAAAALGVDESSVAQFVQDAVAIEGITEAKIRSVNVHAGNLIMQVDDIASYGKPEASRGYRLDADPSSIEASVRFIGIAKVMSPGGSTPFPTCLLMKYKIELSPPNQQPKISVNGGEKQSGPVFCS